MRKNIFAIVALLALVVWGLYDANGKKDDHSNASFHEEKIASAPVGVELGYAAPDFELMTIDGETARLSDFRGKKVLLNMWASWCPPCRAEMPDMQRFYEEQRANEIVILGVNLTTAERSPEVVPRFVEQFGITFPVVLDDEGEVADRYRVSSIPTSYMIDSRGVIRQKVVGPMDAEMMRELMLSME